MCQKTLLFFGDSNTFGKKPIVIPENDHNERYAADIRWTGLIRKALGEQVSVIEEGLSSRTTLHDDPIGGCEKNGLTYLRPCLFSHMPIDVLVLMLGTNDLKSRFAVTPTDIALSVERLILEIKACHVGPNGTDPKLIILCPAPIEEIGLLGKIFKGGAEKSRQLSNLYRAIALQHDALFLDMGKVVQVSQIDGIHYDPDQLPKLADAVLPMIQSIL